MHTPPLGGEVAAGVAVAPVSPRPGLVTEAGDVLGGTAWDAVTGMYAYGEGIAPEGLGTGTPGAAGVTAAVGEGVTPEAGLVGDGDVVPAGEGDVVLAGEFVVVLTGDGDVVLTGEGTVVLVATGTVVPAGDGDVWPEGDAAAGEGDEVLAGEGNVVAVGPGLYRAGDVVSTGLATYGLGSGDTGEGAAVSSGVGGSGREGPGTSLAWLAGGSDGLLGTGLRLVPAGQRLQVAAQ